MGGEREAELSAIDGHGIMDLLRSGRCIKIAAPMVRFSKLPWRHVVRSYGEQAQQIHPLTHISAVIRSQRTLIKRDGGRGWRAERYLQIRGWGFDGAWRPGGRGLHSG